LSSEKAAKNVGRKTRKETAKEETKKIRKG
jgi:hypothetical protein